VAFRDDTEAQRAHVETLEQDLARAHRALEHHEALEGEAEQLRARVVELEAELAKALDTPAARAAREAERIAKERAEAEAEAERIAKEQASSGVGSPGSQRGALAVLLGVLVAGAAGIAVALGDCLPEPWRAGDEPPTLGTVDLAALQQPATFQGTTEGTSSTPGSCPGYVPRAPHLALESPRPTTVVIEASSAEDTVLLVLASDGSFRCDDDSAGDLNPRVAANLPAGRSRVWVGTYESGEGAAFSLTVGGLVAPPAPP
jgi:hypothetical protein